MYTMKWFIIIALMISVKPIMAVEPLTVKELSDLCKSHTKDPNTSESLQCARYIKGFIDGAIAIDFRIASHIQKEEDPTLAERAIETRIRSRLHRFSKPENNDFCLGRPLPLEEIIQKVTQNILIETKEDKPALYSVYKTLRTHYPCETP